MQQAEFDRFWRRYPRKVARLAAEKAYKSARRRATADVILEGVARYCQALPEEPRFIPYAATWLNQGRWLDEPMTASERQHWWEECLELHGGTCDKQWNHEMRKKASA